MNVPVQPKLLQWACDRAGWEATTAVEHFALLPAWLTGESSPTLHQLETFAARTHVPFGYFPLPGPPVEATPIPDFRTVGSQPLRKPSPEFLDTLYACQQRQAWYRDFALVNGEPALSFVGGARTTDNVEAKAGELRHKLGFDVAERAQLPTWTDALRAFVEQAEGAGVLVMVSGIAGSNTHRKLDPGEFRGFALADPLAPLVFVNGADMKAAQMFTLAHELAHLLLGESGISDGGPASEPARDVEQWCNRFAAELLVPMDVLRQVHRPQAPLQDEILRLARHFKVSTLVILRRVFDAGTLTRDAFWAAYRQEVARLATVTGGGGGDFYRSHVARVGRRFARAVITDALEGQTLFRDAYRLLGVPGFKAFATLAANLQVAVESA
jgi:Zn-dependent peptidase ImmA (M78 family)